MANLMDRWLNRRPDATDPPADNSSPTTQDLLRLSIPHCSACGCSLGGHTYRFFACHPALHTGAASPARFLDAVESGDWAAVQASQLPAVDQPILVLYAIACSAPPGGTGMVALLLVDPHDGHPYDGSPEKAQPVRSRPAEIMHSRALTTGQMTALRAQCPTCPWILFSPQLQSPQDPV